MPFLAAIPAIVPALIGAAATTAVSIDQIVNQPSGGGGQLPPGKSPIAPAQSPATPGQIAAANTSASNLQASGGGTLTPDYLASIISSLPNQSNQAALQAVNNLWGLNASGPANAGLSSSGGTTSTPTTGGQETNLASLVMRSLQPPNAVNPTAPGGDNVVQSLLNQDFRGFA